jgi:hypothetical protein
MRVGLEALSCPMSVGSNPPAGPFFWRFFRGACNSSAPRALYPLRWYFLLVTEPSRNPGWIVPLDNPEENQKPLVMINTLMILIIIYQGQKCQNIFIIRP